MPRSGGQRRARGAAGQRGHARPDGRRVRHGQDAGGQHEAHQRHDQDQRTQVAQERVPHAAHGGLDVGPRDLVGALDGVQQHRAPGRQRHHGHDAGHPQRQAVPGQRPAAVGGQHQCAGQQEHRQHRQPHGQPPHRVGRLQRVPGEVALADVHQARVHVVGHALCDVGRDAAHARQHHRAHVGQVEHQRVVVALEQQLVALGGRGPHQALERRRAHQRLDHSLQHRPRRHQVGRAAVDQLDHDLARHHLAHLGPVERRRRAVGERVPLAHLEAQVQRQHRAHRGHRGQHRQEQRHHVPGRSHHGCPA